MSLSYNPYHQIESAKLLALLVVIEKKKTYKQVDLSKILIILQMFPINASLSQDIPMSK